MSDFTPLIVTVLAFAAVASLVFVAGQYLAAHLHLQQRAAGSGRASQTNPALLENIHALVSNYFDEKRFGLTGKVRTHLRRDLVRAGYFRVDAVNYYIFIKFAAVIIVPVAVYFAEEIILIQYGWFMKLFVLAVATAVAILGPDAYIARRQRTLAEKYRVAFPDLLDLMVVCADAGLSLDATIDRLSHEVMKRSRELGMNLLLLGAEIRAGRSTIEALASFSDRLGLDEARAFTAMLRQSIELGTDVGDALRVYSDEMRDRRLLRAEERANQLPVKMVLPLGMFIFPVILMVAMLPVILRLLTVMK
jgi:tight adherence protein C